MSPGSYDETVAITEVTRRAILDELALSDAHWAGRLDEPNFLARIYPMAELRSTDGRFKNAFGDVWQHRVMNNDWDDDWVFTDARFELWTGPDETFLRFLAETVHPVVRADADLAARMVESYNKHLRVDGYEIHASSEISGRPVFSARNLMDTPPAVSSLTEAPVDTTYLSRQVTRMEAAIVSDPDLAIGTAKELVETVAKTILDAGNVEYSKSDGLPRLVKLAAAELQLSRDDVPDGRPAADTIKRLLSNLAMISDGLAELRNAYGTGHGRSASAAGGLSPRHARLAVGAASTLAAFLLETHEARSEG